jgi:hypothetical protein
VEHSIGDPSLKLYICKGALTMSAGGHDVHLTITPYLSLDWTADYSYKIRAVLRKPNGENDASWKHSVALTFMLDLWHSAGLSKQDVESLILGQLRHQKVPAVAVHIQASRLVETSRGKRMVPVFWWSSDTITVIRSSDNRKEKRYTSIWAGSIPSLDKGLDQTNPSFCLRIKLENPRKPMGKPKPPAEVEAQMIVPTVRISLPVERPNLSTWLPITEAPE